MNREVHYNAFISYRHSELDQSVATELHRKIERFSLPKNLRDNYPKDRWKINRVFRDQDELPLASNLSDPIEEALRNSDWLVVICTPRLPESKWCAKEIETFKKLHGQDHILAILAEGEPEESFPEGIRFREYERLDDEGNTVTVREEVEPLAADVRSADPGKRKRMLDDAVLRLAAPMYGLGYDDLKQRHREQKIKKIATISGICAAVFFVFGMCCMALSMKISAQKKVIQEQYVLSQKKYAESMTLVSEELLGSGRRLDSLYSIRSAMPSSSKDDTVPYSASAQNALTNALGVYYSDMLIPDEVMPIPKDDDFWGDAGDYLFLEDYLGGRFIICAQQFDEDNVLVVTSDCRLYMYDPDEDMIADYADTFLSPVPDENVFAAAYRDDTLYLWFDDADYVACYHFKHRDDYESAGNMDTEEYTEYLTSLPPVIENNVPALSDDGVYRFELMDNHSICIYNADSDILVRILYDMHGEFRGMEKLEGTGYYVLRGNNKGYLLNEFLEPIASIPGYCGYSPKKNAFIVYRKTRFTSYDNMIYIPVRNYDELINEADMLLSGYEPSKEIKEEYKMLGY